MSTKGGDMENSGTINQFFIGVGKGIVIGRPPMAMQDIPKEDALNLAAWIVALADDDAGEKGGQFDKVLQEVLNT